MNNTTNFVTAIPFAASLDALLAAINACSMAGIDLAEHGVDLTSLPTYGGIEPADTSEVWSWDDTRMLVGAGREWKIVDRSETDVIAGLIIEAAKEFKTEHGDNMPGAFYVQKAADGSWRAAFAEHDGTNLEFTMTHWNTGAEVEALYLAVFANSTSVLRREANNVEDGWEDEWTDK